MHTWDVEPSAYGDGYWFIRVSQAIIAAILPPGARFPRHDRRHGIEDGSAGWRRAVWRARQASHRPVIDRDFPDEVHEIDTRDVLETLPAHLHELVWEMLQARLRHAHAHGEAARGHARPEDAARAGALAVRWLEDEMRSAFPERAWQVDAADLRGVSATPCTVPDTPEELLALVPRPAARLAQPSSGEERALGDGAASPPTMAPGSQQLLLVLVTSFNPSTDLDHDPFVIPRGSVDIG